MNYRRLVKSKLFAPIADAIHFISGVLAGGTLLLWQLTGASSLLIFSVALTIFFHAYELIEWDIEHDLVYAQLVQFYAGYVAGYLPYILYAAGVVLYG